LSSIVQIVLEALSRRDFLKKIGRGAAAAIAMPWTNLLSAPELAKTVTAPFKIGAGSMLNPQDLHWYYFNKFYGQAVDNGLTDERQSQQVIEWLSKNIINMYVDDVGHSTDREGNTVAPTMSELINHHGWDEEHFIDNPNFPEWAKPLLGKDEEEMTDEEEERYQNLMNSKWFDKELVINWDGEWGHGADEEVEEMLRDWTGWQRARSRTADQMGSAEPEFIDTIFNYIKKMDINEIMKMDFKQEFLPGVVNYAKEMAIARQTKSPGNQQRQAGQDAQKAKDDERGEVPSRHPYGVGSPQSGLQTASTKPTFKEFFNGRYCDAQD
jgi:hypothetical protein